MKKVLGWLCLLVIYVASLGAARADGWSGVLYVRNPNPADRLHVRTEPKKSAASLGKYYNGVYVTVIGQTTADGQWVYVTVEDTGVSGYMSTEFLSTSPVASAMPVASLRYGGQQLRVSPSSSSASKGYYAGGTSVTVLGLVGSWRHVRVNGVTGYMPESAFTGSSSTGSGTTSSPSDEAPWSGPIGYHGIGAWNIPMSGAFACVNNPNPADRLHLRVAPSQGAKSLGKYYNGVRVVVLGSTSGDWTKVSIGNLTGYMDSDFLTVNGTLGYGAPPSAMPIMTVSNPNRVANLHLRERATTASRSMGLYPNGTQVILMGFSEQWAHVIVDGQMGFMLAKFLR